MKKKVVFIPLDERPCNYEFPQRLFSHEDIEIVRPVNLGNKKEAADLPSLTTFLKEACKDADGLVLSVDMLLYGGLVPSRIHNRTLETLQEQAALIKTLKEENPNLIIYAFQVIMRCPNYSSSDEEPDYYEQYGKMIHLAGEIVHKSRLGLCDSGELDHVLSRIDAEKLNDYVSRREYNKKFNYLLIDNVKQGYIDALVIPQDDSAPYGYAAIDQEEVRAGIDSADLSDRILMYPGADEVGLTLISRMINVIHGKKPKVYVKYASEGSKALIPLYEVNCLENTIKYHILSAGCQLTDSYKHADIILAVTAPAYQMEEADKQPSLSKGYCADRNLSELLDFVKNRVAEGKIVTIGDNAYGNGGELLLVRLLNKNGLLDKIAGYAGWNTSANTIGTAIAQGVDFYYYGNTKGHRNFLMSRYIEDAGYCSRVRLHVGKGLAERGISYFDLKEHQSEIGLQVKQDMEQFIQDCMSSVASAIHLKRIWFPWNRMFEIGLEVEYVPPSEQAGTGSSQKQAALGERNRQILQQLRGGLIVSCQALSGEPLHSADIMSKMALAAKEGGAAGIRANSPVNIREIKKAVELPVIALYKQDYENCEVYITPTEKEIELLIAEKPEIIAMDATDRLRPGGVSLEQFFSNIRKKYPDQLFMADCATLEEGINACRLGFDIVGTTLCGYTQDTKNAVLPNLALIRGLTQVLDIPVIAEGGIWEIADLQLIMKEKVLAAVIGTAITRPREITRRYVDSMPVSCES